MRSTTREDVDQRLKEVQQEIQGEGDIGGSVSSGDELCVEVTVNFDSVRWMSGFVIEDGRTLSSKTYMRRE